MIVKMLRTYVVARRTDKDRLLGRLRELGAVHLAPVDPSRLNDQGLPARIQRTDRAIQLVSPLTPCAPPADVSAEQAVEEVLKIQQQSAERNSRLTALYQQLRELEPWGNVRLEQLRELEAAGLDIAFYSLPRKDVAAVQADVVEVLAEQGGGDVLVAAVSRSAKPVAPESAQPMDLPASDAPTIRAEAAQIDEALKADQRRLGELAGLLDALRARRRELAWRLEHVLAASGGLESGDLFAVQGYVPHDRSEALAEGLAGADLPATVEFLEVSPDELPPTQIRYPRWVQPIKGLFNILGITPGYRELDVTSAFMIALPFFAAMLIGDGGYGLLFLLTPLLLYRKAVAKAGKDLIHLVIAIGAASVVWGVLTGSFFGVDVFGLFGSQAPIPVNLSPESRRTLMSLSFYIGAVHLVLAKLWRATVTWPNLAFLSHIGWAIFLWGMLGVVRFFVLKTPSPLTTYHLYLLIVGGALAMLFGYPSRNILKMVLLGVANFPLSMLGTFSDIMSYVRLMAVGLAGSVLAVAFNDLAVSAGPVLMAPILLVGHALNIGLVMIALFSHGVRLNVLEFSNNIGMEWSGYPYRPFADEQQET